VCQPLRLGCWIDAAIILDIVKADADFADVLGWIVRCPEANQWVHLAHEAFFSIVSESEPHLAVPHPCFEVVDQEQGLPIHVDVDAAIALAIGPGRDLHALQQVMELCRPFNDGVLTQWHRCAGVWMILQGFNTLSEGHASRFQKGTSAKLWTAVSCAQRSNPNFIIMGSDNKEDEEFVKVSQGVSLPS
jgi:hypothetical protein